MADACGKSGFWTGKAAIIGVGLIGGSIGKALLARGLCREAVGLFRRQATMDKALAHGLVSRGTMSMKDAVSGAGLVILATGVASIPAMAEAAAPFLAENALVIDAGSVKRVVVEKVCRALSDRPDVLFAGSHPLYGSHLQGPEAGAQADPAGRLALVTPAE
ncbi:MAG TPA: prephenate dehydrogenase/arogenate dehydrogenase family protein, partial [Planctomycetes bacterium]|nr:prephenate dehydrogenase/arogenate dehydrogenase family protein [Planctomycetota bacterium]